MNLHQRLGGLLLILLIVSGCARDAPEPPSLDEPAPLVPTVTPPRAALPTIEPTLSVVVQPSATPDPTQLDATFSSPRGDLSLRYPGGWRLSDRSDSRETLVTIQPLDASNTAFIAHLESSGGPLAPDGLREFARAYVATLFGAADPAPEARQEGPRYILTVRQEAEGATLQYELRFLSHGDFVEVLSLVAPADRWAELAPTLDGIARSVTVAEAELPQLPTPISEASLQQEGLEIARYTVYQREGGQWVVAGTVRNTSGALYTAVTVRATLLDAGGASLGVAAQRTPLHVLPAGAETPFALEIVAAGANAADVSFELAGVVSEEAATRYSQRFDTVVEPVDQPTLGQYALAGEVRNLGAPVEGVRVAAALYDGSAQLLGVVSVVLDGRLGSEESAPFSLTFFHGAAGEVASHQLWVEGAVVE